MAFTGILGSAGSESGLIELGFVSPDAALPNNVAASLSQGGVVPYLWYRVLDPFGNEVVSNLAHLRSKWNIKAPMPGQVTGASVIGDFQVDLPPPGTPEWRDNAQDFAKLAINQRIEGYYGQPGAGNPRVTGIIREKPSTFNSFALKGIDSIGILLGTSTGRSEQFNGRTDQLFMYALQGYAMQANSSDDFSGVIATLWNNNGGWSTNANPNGLAAIKASNSGDGVLSSKTSYANATYNNCYISGWFYLICANTTGSVAEAGCIAAYQDINNYILGRALMRQAFTQGSANSRYEVDAEIWIKSLGTWTLLVRKNNVVVTANNNAWLQVSLFGKQIGATYQWEVQINGSPSGCLYQYQATPAGSTGYRSLITSNTMGPFTFNAANSSCWVSNVTFVAKQNLVNPGNIVQGTKSIMQTFSNTHSLDMVNLAAMTEGYSWRKNPGVGIDTIDFGPSVGTDYSSRVFFIEGDNLESRSSIDTNFDQPVTANRLFGSPGQDNAGYIEWVNIAAAKQYGLWIGTLSVDEASDFGAQQRLVQTITNLQAAPGSAKDLFVIRDEQTADVWRELDYVTVVSPRLGLNNQVVQVMSYTLEEGSPAQEIIGDQYPKSMIVSDLRRLRSLLDGLASGTASVSPSVSSSQGGVVYDSRYGTPGILTFSGGYQPCSGATSGNDYNGTGAQPYRLGFQIPTNFAVIQKILLTFTLTTSSTLAVSGNTGAESGHNHGSTGGETGHSHSHSHTWHAAFGTLKAATLYLNGAAVEGNDSSAPADIGTTANSAGSSGHTHGTGASTGHTHPISASSGSQTATGSYLYLNGTQVNQPGTSTPYGPFATNQFNLDLTAALTTQFGLSSGQWELDITNHNANGGGIIAYIILIGLVKSL